MTTNQIGEYFELIADEGKLLTESGSTLNHHAYKRIITRDDAMYIEDTEEYVKYLQHVDAVIKKYRPRGAKQLRQKPISNIVVVRGKLPKLGDKGCRPYYLYSPKRGFHVLSDKAGIFVNILTRKLSNWILYDNFTKNFIIHGIGFTGAFIFAHDEKDGVDDMFGYTIKDDCLEIHKTETFDIDKIAALGCGGVVCLAKMSTMSGANISLYDLGYVVHYDEEKGWYAETMDSNKWIFKKRLPPTVDEIYDCLNKRTGKLWGNLYNGFEIQVRTHRLVEGPGKSQHPAIWSRKRCFGNVIRARRINKVSSTNKKHYTGDPDKRCLRISKTGCSDWAYFTIGRKKDPQTDEYEFSVIQI